MYTESGQTLQGSFSAVPKPMYATKYFMERSRRDLHNTLGGSVTLVHEERANFTELLLGCVEANVCK